MIGNNKILAQHIWSCLEELNDHNNVVELRQTGMITAFELAQDKITKQLFPWQERRGLTVYNYALKHNLLIRPLGNTIYFMPPYVITQEEIDLMTNVVKEAINLAVQ